MPVDSEYGMREHIIKELKYGQDIFRKANVWPVVDVSQKAVEETASIITWMAQERFRSLEGVDPNAPETSSVGLCSLTLHPSGSFLDPGPSPGLLLAPLKGACHGESRYPSLWALALACFWSAVAFAAPPKEEGLDAPEISFRCGRRPGRKTHFH